MKNHVLMTILLTSIPLGFAQGDSATVNQLLGDYAKQGASIADAEQGKILWQKGFVKHGESSERSCASCHTKDLTLAGKHVKTNKEIKPMAPSVNPQRLTDIKKIDKWFKRNCLWTMGRECSAQEKANILTYIENQPVK